MTILQQTGSYSVRARGGGLQLSIDVSVKEQGARGGLQ